MMMRLGLTLAIALSATALAGEVIPVASDGRTWAKRLATEAMHRHPAITGIVIDITRDPAKGEERAGEVGRAGPVVRDVALVNMSGVPIGTAHVGFRSAKAADADTPMLARELGRDVMNARHMFDPWPFDPRYTAPTRAQRLVDATRAKHPELMVLAIHADVPGGRENVIIGSTIGRIGKRADDDDRRVIDGGVTNREVVGDGARYALELPLLDARGRRIGALGAMFVLTPGADRAAIEASAVAIRDALARQIKDAPDLFRR